MPNIPQDVTHGAPNPESYSSTVSGTVTDNVTKLMWQHPASSTKVAQGDGSTYCSSLVLGGYDDWRLPTLIELASIIEYPNNEIIDLAINSAFGGTLVDDSYWSATPLAGSARLSAWSVAFNGGTILARTSSTLLYVRCVR